MEPGSICAIKKLVQKGILNPNDVSINFISRNSNGNSEIHNLPLNSQGDRKKLRVFHGKMEVLTSIPFLTYSIKSDFVENYENVKNKNIFKFLNYIDLLNYKSRAM